MRNIKLIFVFFVLISLISCSASYEELTKSNYNSKNEFSRQLLKAYQEKAVFEAEEMHDWNSTKLYSEKAIKAIKGEKILPQKITYWKIPANKRFEIIKGYNNLMTVYQDSVTLDPYNLAKAISSLDCWAEQQEENWQSWDINKCRDDFLIAMHNLYDAITKNQKIIEYNKSKSKNINIDATIVTQDKNNNILQIVYFDFDKSKLTKVAIDKINIFIERNKNISKFTVIGHTDTKGKKKYNQQLSIQRAETIKLALVDLGIDPKSVKIIGKGEDDLQFITEDEIAHPANRRAEISPLK